MLGYLPPDTSERLPQTAFHIVTADNRQEIPQNFQLSASGVGGVARDSLDSGPGKPRITPTDNRRFASRRDDVQLLTETARSRCPNFPTQSRAPDGDPSLQRRCRPELTSLRHPPLEPGACQRLKGGVCAAGSVPDRRSDDVRWMTSGASLAPGAHRLLPTTCGNAQSLDPSCDY